ncbi:ABCA1, partial [Symbiodinium microadriaticum]
AETLSNVGAEQSYRLPFHATSGFVGMFEELDLQKAALGIAEYGISVTTLEEVFIRVGKNTEETRKRSGSSNAGASGIEAKRPIPSADDHARSDPATTSLLQSEQNGRESPHDKYAGVGSLETDSDSVVFYKHFRALFLKRFIYGKRDRRMFLCQIVLPVLMVVLGLGLLQLTRDYDQPGLTLTPAKFNVDIPKFHRNYVVFNPDGGDLGDQIMARFNGDHDGDNDAEDGGGVWGIAVPMDSQEDDQFYNCSSGPEPLFNISNYMLKNLKPDGQRGSSHYGSVTVAAESTLDKLSYNILVNGSAVHGAGIYMNLVHEAFLQILTGSGSASIKVRNYPLPRTWEQQNNAATVDAFTAALFFMIAFCFIPASYASFIVKEKEVKAKHQQIISGVSIYAYWCSSYVWDILSYLPTVALVVCIVLAFGVDNYTKNDGAPATFLLFLLYGPAVASFTYLMSFMFTSHSTAQLVVMFFNFLSGLCLMVVSFVLTTINSTESVAVDLRYIFRLFPSFCLGDGLTQLALCDNGENCPNIGRNGYDFNAQVSPFHWNIVGVDDSSFDKNSIVDDEDVAMERVRVDSGGADSDVVRIADMRKVFNTPIGKKVAVNCLSFGIPKGECFGFLGINGAGMDYISAGTAYIDGYNIQHDQRHIRRKIGYCPQFDALLELLTVREHLELYGRIKGLQGGDLERVVLGKLQQMDLKLSVAIAMIGEPSIVFLDEPSTGMDPMERRFMWQVISRISTQDAICSIILTTHSMEEAEALCTRIGIMVNGSLRCLGSGTHLKMRFGDGYEVDVKLNFAPLSKLRALRDALVDANVLSLDDIQLDDSGHPGDVEHASADVEDDSDATAAEEGKFKKIRVTADFASICNALHEPERVSMFTSNGEGGTLYDVMHADGFVSLHSLLEWWVAQDDAVRLDQFMINKFPGTMLLERRTAHSFRYRIPTKDMALAKVFKYFEDEKSVLNIQDYSVGQTTLEQIFNQFASSQDNPENSAAAKGVEVDRVSSRESLNLQSSASFKRTNTSSGI